MFQKPESRFRYFLQGKVADDLCWAIMHEFTKLVYRVSEMDVTRAKNQVRLGQV